VIGVPEVLVMWSSEKIKILFERECKFKESEIRYEGLGDNEIKQTQAHLCEERFEPWQQ
jgi:hypothetical protein